MLNNIGEFAKTIGVNALIQKKQLKKNSFKRIPFWVKKNQKYFIFFESECLHFKY